MRIAAVVVNWNGGDANLECVAALRAQGAALEAIVFVDNASSDGSRERVLAAHPGVVSIDTGANLGYGGGNNLGIAWALERGFDAVLVLNNDIVLPPGQLELLARALEADPRVGIVGPRVLRMEDPERIWAAGGLLTWRENLTTLRGAGERDGEPWQRTVPVDYVVGCALLVRRAVFEQIGLFDADYFAYTEDVDFGLRAAKAGFASVCAGEARALHAASTSTGGGYNPRRKYMMGVNSIWFLRRWGGAREWCSFFVYDVLTLPFLLLLGVARGQGKAVVAKGLGIVDGLRGKHVRAEMLTPGATWLW